MKLTQHYSALRKSSLKGLQVFEAAYVHRNFSAAADELFITPSAVSHSIRLLEESLNTKLFERIKRQVIPTDAAHILYRSVSKAFRLIDNDLLAISQHSFGKEIVNIHAPPSLVAILIMPKLANFLREHPNIDIRLWALPTEPDFRQHALDFAIVYGEIPYSMSLDIKPLSEHEHYVPYCSPTLIQKTPLPLSPEMLKDFPLIHSDRSIFSWADWVNQFVEEAINIDRGIHFDRSFMVLSSAIDDIGMCFESNILAHPYVSQNKLIQPFGDLKMYGKAHYLCIPKEKIRQKKTRILVDWICSLVV